MEGIGSESDGVVCQTAGAGNVFRLDILFRPLGLGRLPPALGLACSVLGGGLRLLEKARRLPAKTPLSKKQKWSIAIYAFLTLVFGTYNLGVLTSHWPADEALEISFPLRSGTYYVAHGGSQVQMNYHSAHPPQRYALDIVRLNRLGTRAKGLYPKELTRYEIFGDPVYSPCTGKVIEARDDLPDLTPRKWTLKTRKAIMSSSPVTGMMPASFWPTSSGTAFP